MYTIYRKKDFSTPFCKKNENFFDISRFFALSIQIEYIKIEKNGFYAIVFHKYNI